MGVSDGPFGPKRTLWGERQGFPKCRLIGGDHRFAELPRARAELTEAEAAKGAAELPYFSKPLATLHARLAAH